MLEGHMKKSTHTCARTHISMDNPPNPSDAGSAKQTVMYWYNGIWWVISNKGCLHTGKIIQSKNKIGVREPS
jgi:hypothetical protein